MRIVKRKISLREFKTFQEGLLYGEFVEPNMYLKVDLIQSGDDMGIFTDLDFRVWGDICSDFYVTLDISHISCYDPNSGEPANTGAISIDISGGLEPYTVLWDIDESDDLVKGNLIPGDYGITVTDDNGCEVNLIGTVEVSQNAIPNVYASFTQDYFDANTVVLMNAGDEKPISALPEPVILCEGESATLTADGNYASYEWFNDGVSIGNTQSITTQVDGIYSVVVTDAEGCDGESETQSIEFIVSPVPVATVLSPTLGGSGVINDPFIVCHPTIQPLTLSEVSGYFSSWHWSWGSTTQTITRTNSSVGLARVDVEVPSTCEPTVDLTASVYLNILAPNDPLCFESESGSF